MLTLFYFENKKFASIVKDKILELLDTNDLCEKGVSFFHETDDNPNFFVVVSPSVDEDLASSLIRDFDWESIGVTGFKERWVRAT